MPTVWDEDFEEEQIDTLKNPGAQHPIPGMWLLAAWRMWFGPGAFRHLPKDRLLNFGEAHRVEELGNEGVFIELFEDPAAVETEAARQAQAAFNRWVNKAGLVANAANLLTGPEDPSHEIEHGNFEHGGVKRLTAWFDKDGNSVRKSKAAEYVTQELDGHGGVVWQLRGGVED